jgi:hypothetical protein
MNLIITGLVLFLIGLLDDRISDLFYEYNNDIRIYGWGWIPQLIGGLLAIYGFMIYLEEYLGIIKQRYKGLPQPPPFPFVLLMDKEMKKLIWLFMIVTLVICILLPGLDFLFLLIFLLILVIVIILFPFIFDDQRHYFPYQPHYYPPPQQILYKSPPAPPPIGNIKSCKRCHTQLEPDWIVCPFCGEPDQAEN